jgi:hypothetical protein
MIFETRGKYKGLAFVKQLLGEKAEAERKNMLNLGKGTEIKAHVKNVA